MSCYAAKHGRNAEREQMAHLECQLNSLGIEGEQCSGCERGFKRGERMNAVASEEGFPLGWYCDGCIEDWKQNGIESRAAKAMAA